MAETPVSFHARRWLLSGTPWAALPEALRQAPWAAWRHGCGLLQCCAGADLPAQVSALLQAHPQAHLTVLAPDATPAERHAWRHAAPDAEAAERVSIVFDLTTLEALLTLPETECSEWLGRDGHVLLPVPLDPLTDAQRAEWQTLMTAWTEACLRAVHDEMKEAMDDLQAASSTQPQALAALADPSVLEQALLLHGFGEDDTLPVEELDGSTDAWSANDDLYQAIRLFAAGDSGTTDFYFNEVQATLSVQQRHQPEVAGEELDDEAVYLEIKFERRPTMAPNTEFLRIELYDKTVESHNGWEPLPIVLTPTSDNLTGPWVIDGAEHPGLAKRWEGWLQGQPALGADVWVRTTPAR